MNAVDYCQVLNNAISWLQQGKRVVLVTVVRDWGSAPSPLDSLFAINADGDFTGSVSDNTRVPPVKAEKSPPDSRMTGADSPVMALTVCFKARNDAACALMRPSASASAKLANKTVNQSQTEIDRINT